MLVLSRRTSEQIIIGQDITVTVVRVQGDKVTLGIEAPDDIEVDRAEIRGAKRRTTEEKMTEQELMDKKSIAVEPYGGGFILADYSGNRGEASYRGVRDQWSPQPIQLKPVFPTKEEAIAEAIAADECESTGAN